MHKITSLFLLLCIAVPCSYGQGVMTEKWSLQECIAHAYEHNITIEQAQLRAEIAKNNLQTAQMDYLPNLNLGNNVFWNFGLNIDPVTNQISRQSRQTVNFQLSSNWVLYNGGAKYNTIAQRNHDLKAAQYDYEAARNEIGLQVASAYLQIMLNKEIAAVAREQVRITDLQLRRTKKLVEAGSLPEGELLQLEAQLARDQQNSLVADNNVNITRLVVANLLQLEDPSAFDVADVQLVLPDGSILDRSPENLFQVALERQPNIRAAEMRVLSGEEGIDIAYSGYLPSLSLIGQVGTNYSDQIPNITGTEDVTIPFGFVAGSNDLVLVQQSLPVTDGVKPFGDQVSDNLNEVVGFTLNVPIFNRRTVANNLQNARISADLNRLGLEQVKNDLRQTIFQAHIDATSARLQFNAAAKSVEANKKAFEYARQRFEVGALNQVDFESAKNNLAASQSQYAQAKYDYIFKVKVLEFYLTNQVNL